VLLVIVIISLMFGFQLPAIENIILVTQDQLVQNQILDNRTYWMDLVNTAWQYYQPGAGVDSSTGLHHSEISYPGFTDWDLGVYVQAVVDAAKLGIIANETSWGFDYRIDKVLSFLEERSLASDGTPYTWYSSKTKANTDSTPQIAADAGNLLAALKNAEQYRPQFASRIDNIVNSKTNYENLKQAVERLSGSVNIYDYYVTTAFACFWPERFATQANTILSNIINSPTITYEGVTLPKAKLMCEPLLLAIFNLKPDLDLMDLMRTVYLAHEARYNTTGKYVAFTEGSPVGVASYYVWEWVVIPDGQTWVTQRDENTNTDMTPVVFLKAAVGLQVLFDTQFTQNMINDMIPALRTSNGFLEGKSETGQIVRTVTDKTNGMILSAALYAINNNVNAPILAPSTTGTPIIDDTPQPNDETNINSPANPTATSLPTSSISPENNVNSSPPISTPQPTDTTAASTTAAPSTPLASLTPSTSSSTPPTIDAFSLTQPIIIAASVVAVSALSILAIIYRRKKSKSATRL
jgi:hypothetical protein